MPIILTAAAVGLCLLIFVASVIPRGHSEEAIRLFGHAFLERADEYARLRYVSWVMKNAAIMMILAAMTLLQSGGRMYEGLRMHLGDTGGLFGTSLGVFLILTGVTLPFDYYSGFLIEREFGFATQSGISWLGDYLKSAAITMVIAVLGLTALVYISRRFPHTWWVLAAGGYAAFVFLWAMLSPIIIDPIFYRFRPVEDVAFKEKVIQMARTANIKVDEVLEVNASKKTLKGNAYFTGVFGTKRIVIYDNLLRRYPKRYSLLVIAHEIGHWSKGHIRNGILLSSLLGLVFLAILRKTSPTPLYAGDLPAIILLALAFIITTLPLSNAISRLQEREADRVVFDITGDTAGWVDLEIRLSRHNLGDVEPHPVIRAALFSHPSALERIRAAKEYLPQVTPP
ncbi:MAG TPA: M48 family metallopeptidase [Clostridia bacterium]|nr:M48 family metallopeptidase [Clostridia bacterium]